MSSDGTEAVLLATFKSRPLAEVKLLDAQWEGWDHRFLHQDNMH